MSIFKFFAAMVFALLSLPLVACGGGGPNSMDMLNFNRTKLDSNETGWTGAVVKSQMLEENLYKVLVERAGSDKLDTLLATTNFAVGAKVKYIKVVGVNPGNDIPINIRFAVPADAEHAR